MVAAAVVQYRKQFIDTFEQHVSMFRLTTTREHVINGNSAVFLVAGSGGATAVTRGANGQIPYGATSNTQKTATLVEKHAPFEITGFNIFASQGDQNAIMRKASMSVINRDIDLVNVAILDTATNDTGAAVTASMDLIAKSQAILGINNVPLEDEANIFAAITPAFRAYLLQTTEYASGDFVDIKPLTGPARKVWRWAGINFFLSTALTGMGTATEKCYMWHRDALGYAINAPEEKTTIGYDEKQETSWSRATVYHGATLLQNSGVVQMLHDGSAYVAT